MSRGSSYNADCQEFFKETKIYITKLTNSINTLEKSLDELSKLRYHILFFYSDMHFNAAFHNYNWFFMFFRTQHPISPTFVSGVKNPNIVTEFKEVEDTIKSGHTFQESFTKIVKNESNCSSTMFFKAKYVPNQYKLLSNLFTYTLIEVS